MTKTKGVVVLALGMVSGACLLGSVILYRS